MDARTKMLEYAELIVSCGDDGVQDHGDTAFRLAKLVVAEVPAISAEVARAVAEERERAAQVAETYEAFGCRLPGTTCAGCPADSTWNDGACVAQNIRACVGGKEEGR